MNTRRLRRELRDFTNKTEQPLKLYSGALGITIGGVRYVDVPNRPGFVYVRLRNNVSELIQAHNEQVSPAYDLPVLVVRTHNYYEIYSRDSQQYASYWVSSSSYLPRHGFQHEFNPDNGGGGDLVFVHGEQFYPLMGFPSGTDAANNILIAPYRYYFDNQWRYAGNTGSPDLLQYRPTGSFNAKLVLVGITASSGNPFVKVGTEFDASITGAAALTSYVPTNITITTEIPGTIVRLVTGTTGITWANIYDARQYMGILQATSLTGTSFLNLSDTPDSYAGAANQVVSVNAGQTALEFTTPVSSFLSLTDTPDSYSGQAGKFVAVNAGANALEFVTGSSGGGAGTSAMVMVERIRVENTPTRHIVFSNIPQNYYALKFIGTIRTDRAASAVDAFGSYFNGVSGGTRVYSSLDNNETSATTLTATQVITGTVARIFERMPAILSPVGSFGAFELTIPEYALTGTAKTGYAIAGGANNYTSNNVNAGNSVIHYHNTEQIHTAIFNSLNSANIVSGSSITLYALT